jgi:hypothetical protein
VRVRLEGIEIGGGGFGYPGSLSWPAYLFFISFLFFYFYFASSSFFFSKVSKSEIQIKL